MTSGWTPRFADLTGKAVVVAAGDGWPVADVVAGLAANGALIAVVSADRTQVDQAVLRLAADPSSRAVWERVAAQVEQRLGPIDVAVAMGDDELRRVVRAALAPDMTARRRGVLIEIGTSVEVPDLAPGLRHRGIECDSADADLAATVLLCASDSVSSPVLTIRLS